jgi:GT2 family glycosyltransferase
MKLSYVIVTHNRREPLLKTLEILHRTTPLPHERWDTWVVDNASSDGTVSAVRERHPGVRVMERATNEGVWARSHAFGPARGEYLILLDDDSYPIGDAAAQSIAYLDRTPGCAAVVGKVILPDGSHEACAMPGVMLSGAVCIRKSVLKRVGGFRPEFFRKAGEYDLSFRIWQAGYSVERFEDVVYRHDKVMTGRSAPFAHRMDLRNNLILVERYLPEEFRREYRRDWTQRYSLIAAHAGYAMAAVQARIEAAYWAIREETTGRQILSQKVVEILFQHERQYQAVAQWARMNAVRSVKLADFSKTIYATYQACVRAGLNVLAIVDDHPAFAGARYRDIPVVSSQAASAMNTDGVVLTNVNPAQIDTREAAMVARFNKPVLRLWHPRNLATPYATGVAA